MKYFGHLEKQMKKPAFKKLVVQERLIAQTQEEICRLMEAKDVSKAELAKRLGKTRSYVTQLLDSGRNLTLRTIADVFAVLNEQPAILTRTEAATASHGKVASKPSEKRETWKTTTQTSRVRSGYTSTEDYDSGLLFTCTIIQHAPTQLV